MPLLISALFYDLTPDKTVTISSQSERRERDLQELFRRAKKPAALFVDDAHDLHPKTLVALKRLTEVVVEGGGQLSVVLVGHPKLKNDLRRPKMEESPWNPTKGIAFGNLYSKMPHMSSAFRRSSPPRMAVADFLDWPGDDTAKRFQLVDGDARAMAPASATHGIVQATLAYLITRRLIETGSPCRVMTEPAIVPRVRAATNLRVPDLGVTCAPSHPGQIVVSDPVLLIEILSPSNEAATRENIWAYATIPSVREILVVHSTRVAAELLRRHADGTWPEQAEDFGPNGTLRLDSIDLTCPLPEIYARTYLA